MMKCIVWACLGLIYCLEGANAANALLNQEIKGAGPSTQIAKVFFEELALLEPAAGYTFNVEERSTKHAGGINASGVFLFGRTGRPLSTEELSRGKEDLFLASIPVGFVVGSEVGLNEMTAEQVRSVYCRQTRSWAELGGPDQPIYITGREPAEASLSVLKLSYPFLKNAQYDLTLKRDHAVANLLQSSVGRYAIAYGPLLNFDKSLRVEVEGENPLLPMGLVYDVANRDHPLVRAAVDFAKTEHWHERVEELGYSVVTTGMKPDKQQAADRDCR